MNFLGVMATIPTIERKISKSLATTEYCETKAINCIARDLPSKLSAHDPQNAKISTTGLGGR
jgi:hypothetical protein